MVNDTSSLGYKAGQEREACIIVENEKKEKKKTQEEKKGELPKKTGDKLNV